MASVPVTEKNRLREVAKVNRAAAFATHGPSAGELVAAHGLGFLGAAMAPGSSVAGFSAIRDEINPAPLLLGLHANGHPLALPTIQGRARPLVFQSWSPGDAMAPAVWGIAEPLPTRPIVHPDIVLVPLLAFDSEGYRLGYGGGFYDRSLAELRQIKPIVAVGLAYDEQRLDAVPRLDYDEPLDWVLTPSGPFRCVL